MLVLSRLSYRLIEILIESLLPSLYVCVVKLDRLVLKSIWKNQE